jgi:hypothetical protein
VPYTAAALCNALATRKKDLVLATADAAVSPTVLQATDLLQAFPADNAKAFYWVYAPAQANPTDNRGLERRALAWNATTRQLTLAPPGFPVAPTSGTYEIHRRYRRSELLDAINSCIRRLHLYWWRPVRSENIVTADKTWRYRLDSSTHWGGFSNLLIEISQDPSQIGYPFTLADPWNPVIEREVGDTGIEVFYLRFGSLPPWPRTLRLWATVGYTDLVDDTDVLPIDGEWGGLAYEWLLLCGSILLDDWALEGDVSGDVEKHMAIVDGRVQRMYRELMAARPSPPNIQISIPGVRDGLHPGYPHQDIRYLSSLHSP